MAQQNLFQSHTTIVPAILLIDSSGSVHNRFNDGLINGTIFDKILQISATLDSEEFRLIFWNSDNNEKQFFKGGFYRYPNVVKKEQLMQPFYIVGNNIDKYCLTYPRLGFDAIPNNWIDNVNLTKIYFITDGDITTHWSDEASKLGKSITRLFDNHNNIQLNIITVEYVNRDFNDIESVSEAAGNDVYEVIKLNQLTKYVTKFISYTPNNLDGFININRNIAPKGFIPYEDKFFSESKINQFIKYLINIIANTDASDEANLLKILQNLSTTMAVLTQNKPQRIKKDITKTFCSLFKNTSIMPLFANHILTNAIEQENRGSANLYADYRNQLKNLYKLADQSLTNSVRDAIGVNNMFTSFPIANKIISGNTKLIDKTFTTYKRKNVVTYSQGVLNIPPNNILIPALPANFNGSPMNEQCIRQWVRTIVSKLYNVSPYDDSVIYIMLAIVLQVVSSPGVANSIKNDYRKYGTIMLKKKRLRTDVTELSRLEDGHPPSANSGKAYDLATYFGMVKETFKLNLEPFTIWYAMCLALNNNKLTTKQLIHCSESIKKDFPNIDIADSRNLLSEIAKLITPVEHYTIPTNASLDYQCIISMDDISNIGGYGFLPHKSLTGYVCSPAYTMSADSFNEFCEDMNQCVCPICYADLTKENFKRIGKKVSIESLNIFPENTVCNLAFEEKVADAPAPRQQPRQRQVAQPQQPATRNGTLIVMKGVVGSGKSSFSRLLKEKIEQLGGHCIIEGFDKYVSQGHSHNETLNIIRRNLNKVKQINNKNLFVITDTCGEFDQNRKRKEVFGVQFDGWNKYFIWANYDKNIHDRDLYYAWSLRNVLQRGVPDNYTNDNFLLNPLTAGLSICISVHQKKGKKLFGKKNKPQLFAYTPDSIESAITALNHDANTYANQLEKYTLETQVDDIIKRYTR